MKHMTNSRVTSGNAPWNRDVISRQMESISPRPDDSEAGRLAAKIDKLTNERDGAVMAFEALKEFCETELHWMYFRTEFLLEKGDSRSKTIENARKLKDYLAHLKEPKG